MKILFLFCSLSLLSCAQDTNSKEETTNDVISERLKDQQSDRMVFEKTEERVDTTEITTSPIVEKKAPYKIEVSKKETAVPMDKEVVRIEEEWGNEATVENPAPADYSGVYGQLLSSNVSTDGRVNYKGLLASKTDIAYAISYFQKNAPTSSWSKNKTMAYWINAYNLFTLKLIVDHYPVKSILDISNGKPWDDKFIEIGGKKLSLNDIENNILRKDYSDPRIHFAINCASISCPKLLNKPYTESNLNALLDAQAKRYLMDPKQNSLSKEKLEIAEIFNWFKEDFKVVGGVTAFIEKQTGMDISEKATITYKKYNWNLNE